MTKETRLKWQIPEYPHYTRGIAWYIGAALVGGALLIYTVKTGNFLFALIIVIGVLLSLFSSMKTPATINFSLSEDGAKLGELFYPWEKFQSYWIVNEDGVTNLGLDLKNWLQTDLYIPVKNYSVEEVEKFVSQFLKKNPARKEEPLSYFLGRKLKI